MAARYLIHWVSGGTAGVQTVGASTGVICSFDLSSTSASPDGIASNGCSVSVEANVLSYDTVSFDSGARVFNRAFKRIAGTITGTDAAIISVVLGTLPGQLATLTYDLVISGNVIQLTTSGVVGRTIAHTGDMRIRIWQYT